MEKNNLTNLLLLVDTGTPFAFSSSVPLWKIQPGFLMEYLPQKGSTSEVLPLMPSVSDSKSNRFLPLLSKGWHLTLNSSSRADFTWRF